MYEFFEKMNDIIIENFVDPNQSPLVNYIRMLQNRDKTIQALSGLPAAGGPQDLTAKAALMDIWGHFRFALDEEEHPPLPKIPQRNEAHPPLPEIPQRNDSDWQKEFESPREIWKLLLKLYQTLETQVTDMDFLFAIFSIFNKMKDVPLPKIILIFVTACYSGKMAENMERLSEQVKKIQNSSQVLPPELCPIEKTKMFRDKLQIERKYKWIDTKKFKSFLDRLLVVTSIGSDFSDAGNDSFAPYYSALFAALGYALEKNEYIFKNWPLKRGTSISISPEQLTPESLVNFLEEASFDIAYNIAKIVLLQMILNNFNLQFS